MAFYATGLKGLPRAYSTCTLKMDHQFVRNSLYMMYSAMAHLFFSHSSDKVFFFNLSVNTTRENLKLAQNFELVLL